MALNLASPGISIKEIDQTLGRVGAVVDQTGAITGPFSRGPVNEPILIESEKDLIDTFGKPSKTDNQYEFWLSASHYLSYGGNLQVVRCTGGSLNNANAGVSVASTTLLIENYEDYQDNHASDTAWRFASKNPGIWGNGLKVCVIDAFADQILSGLTTNGVSVGAAVTATASAVLAGSGTTSVLDGYIKGVVTEIGPKSGELSVKFYSHVNAAGTETTYEYTEGSAFEFKANTAVTVGGATGAATTSFTVTRAQVGTTAAVAGQGANIDLYDLVGTTAVDNAGGASVGTAATGFFVSSTTGITTSTLLIVNSEIIAVNAVLSGNFVAIGTDASSAAANRGQVGTTTATHVDGSTVSIVGAAYTVGTVGSNNLSSASDTSLSFVGTGSSLTVGDFLKINDEFLTVATAPTTTSSLTPTGVRNWYDEQVLGLDNSEVYWRSIAPKPKTSNFASSRGARNDELHIVVVDDDGTVTGTPGSIIEKHIALSKATDAVRSSQQNIYFKDYVADGSENIFAGTLETGSATGFTAGTDTVLSAGAGAPGQNAADVTAFSAFGKKIYTLAGGLLYSGDATTEGYSITIGNLNTGYEEFNDEGVKVDYLIMGPSLSSTREETQAKANKVIAIAEERKDCVAVVSPHRSDVVGNASGSKDITDKIIKFYSGVTHSSYAVFDSGYKYTYDRFTNSFVYLPTNADVAGMMARTASTNFAWYSPAGSSRGAMNNAIKLAYNPTKLERDRLYSNSINPIITTRGSGTILFGDKTGLSVDSAFDRINVRKLFLFIEEAIGNAARSQLFEFNDSVTRSNFVNIVEPFLRDIKGKRGLSDFRVICDETNNTPDVIDRNEFRADIFVQPARSINFVSLTFVATPTGVAFEESVG